MIGCHELFWASTAAESETVVVVVVVESSIAHVDHSIVLVAVATFALHNTAAVTAAGHIVAVVVVR